MIIYINDGDFMKYQSFNKSNLKSQIKELEELYETKKLKSIQNDIEILHELLEETPDEVFPLPYLFKDLLMDDSIYIKKHQSFITDINKFASLSRIMKDIDYKYIDTWNIPMSSLFSFVHDFYNSLDKEIAKYFNRIFKERRNNFKLSDYRSCMLTIKSLKYSYINVERGDTITVYLSMVHEYAHAIADAYQHRDTLTIDKYPYVEYFPLLIELLALDKLNDMFYDFEDDTNIIKKEKLNLMLSYAKDIAIEAFYLENTNGFKNKKDTINDLKDITNLPRRYFKNMFNTIAREKLTYIIPYMTAIESYYQYQEDPKLALENAKTLVTLPKAKEYRSILYDLGLNLNEHTQEYTTDVKRKILKIQQN